MKTFDKKKWAGQKYVCGTTGEFFTIPEDVCRGAFYSFGKSFVDCGDGYYCRWGGNPIRIPNQDETIISRAELDDLLEMKKQLDCFYAHGVDSWDKFEAVMNDYVNGDKT
jgi:hypothetical protein